MLFCHVLAAQHDSSFKATAPTSRDRPTLWWNDCRTHVLGEIIFTTSGKLVVQDRPKKFHLEPLRFQVEQLPFQVEQLVGVTVRTSTRQLSSLHSVRPCNPLIFNALICHCQQWLRLYEQQSHVVS